MPSVYYLNPPPNPFWSFVNDLDSHPFFGGFPEHVRNGGPPAPPPPRRSAWARPERGTPAPPPQPPMSEAAKGKQPTVEDDPPIVDPSTIKPETKKPEETQLPFHGRRARFGRPDRPDRPDREEREERRQRGHPCGRRNRGFGGWGGPPPFMFGHPFAGPPPEHRGPPGPPGEGPHHHPSDHSHHRRRSPHRPRRELGQRDFDLGGFLNNLGDRLGVDLSGAAEGLGLTTDRFSAPKSGEDVNFEPKTDIFENADAYIMHCSLPGCRKEDVGVDYDGENSLLRITGVSHKPGVDESMMKQLVVDGRNRETGVFEKVIRLGTKRDPANVDVQAISAKMDAGILVVKVPKTEAAPQKREVPITTDPVAEGKADYEDDYSEKPVLFDASEQASIAGTEPADAPKREEINLVDMQDSQYKEKNEPHAQDTKPTTKAEESKQETKNTQAEHHAQELPAYAAEEPYDDDDEEPEEDWEKFSDASGEGEFIKINVN
ncbi:hypothetical protein LTR64_008169 [Lithohypha guttulata]|uniref:uncharacterized protein n=1 Tax=Lithohypha guttulata TaxID=1690604 RepID=UPI002DE03EFD|nr:hypothetical protein LTR51_008321 [Lithohypha guttulata]